MVRKGSSVSGRAEGGLIGSQCVGIAGQMASTYVSYTATGAIPIRLRYDVVIDYPLGTLVGDIPIVKLVRSFIHDERFAVRFSIWSNEMQTDPRADRVTLAVGYAAVAAHSGPRCGTGSSSPAATVEYQT